MLPPSKGISWQEKGVFFFFLNFWLRSGLLNTWWKESILANFDPFSGYPSILILNTCDIWRRVKQVTSRPHVTSRTLVALQPYRSTVTTWLADHQRLIEEREPHELRWDKSSREALHVEIRQLGSGITHVLPITIVNRFINLVRFSVFHQVGILCLLNGNVVVAHVCHHH